MHISIIEYELIITKPKCKWISEKSESGLYPSPCIEFLSEKLFRLLNEYPDINRLG